MNLFRREDMGYTNPQPNMFAQGSQSILPSQSGQPGPNVGQSQPFTAFSAVNLPGYPGCGMLSRNEAQIGLPQQQQQKQRAPGLPVNSSEKVCAVSCSSPFPCGMLLCVLMSSCYLQHPHLQDVRHNHSAILTCTDIDHWELCHMAGHKQDGPAGVR